MDKNLVLYPEVRKERFGRNLAALLKQKELTNEDLKNMLSIGSVQAVYKWTEGKSIPEIGTLCGLSKILDVSIEVLLEPDYHMERKEERSGLRKADRIRFFQTAVLLFRRLSIRIILSEC